jgi:hypothetical protein
MSFHPRVWTRQADLHCPEVLASLFADEVAVVVPPTQLGNCEDKTIAVSKLFGSKSMDVLALKATSPKDYSSDAFKASLRKASGLLPFHAWVGTSDLKDEHVMVRPQGKGRYEIASIDFASAFGFDASGGAVAVPPGPPLLIADEHRDQTVIRQAIERIEAATEVSIRSLVEKLPDDVLARADKDRITAGLNIRKAGIRSAFQAAGWLPDQPRRG